jgi:hypothetical protein
MVVGMGGEGERGTATWQSTDPHSRPWQPRARGNHGEVVRRKHVRRQVRRSAVGNDELWQRRKARGDRNPVGSEQVVDPPAEIRREGG